MKVLKIAGTLFELDRRGVWVGDEPVIERTLNFLSGEVHTGPDAGDPRSVIFQAMTKRFDAEVITDDDPPPPDPMPGDKY